MLLMLVHWRAVMRQPRAPLRPAVAGKEPVDAGTKIPMRKKPDNSWMKRIQPITHARGPFATR